MQDYIEIANLLAAYGQRLDSRDAAGWAALFTKDAVLSVREQEIAGAVALTAFAEGSTRGVHVGGHPLIEITGDEATVAQPLTFLADDGTMPRRGWYSHHIVRTGEGWRFRRIDIRLNDAVSWTE